MLPSTKQYCHCTLVARIDLIVMSYTVLTDGFGDREGRQAGGEHELLSGGISMEVS